jgi:hypothetical protein
METSGKTIHCIVHMQFEISLKLNFSSWDISEVRGSFRLVLRKALWITGLHTRSKRSSLKGVIIGSRLFIVILMNPNLSQVLLVRQKSKADLLCKILRKGKNVTRSAQASNRLISFDKIVSDCAR